MSDVQQYQQTPEVTTQDGGLSALGRWALDARQAYQVAQSLAQTSFVPASMKGKAGEITAAILTGQEVGLEPMSALRSIDIIQGTPAMRANAMRGLVQSRGHDVWVEDSTVTRAVVCGQRKGGQHVEKSVWTVDRATKMGLTGKDNWKKQPDAMLVARATAEVCRRIAADVLLGLPYAVEELDGDANSPDATGPSGPRRTARRRPVESPTPDVEPDLAPESPEVVGGAEGGREQPGSARAEPDIDAWSASESAGSDE